MTNKLINDDGKIIIQPWLALITIIILLGTTLTSIVAVTVSAKSDIEKNTEVIDECKEEITDIKDLLIDHEKRLTTIEAHYDYIKDQLDRIETKLEGLV
ncbi:hypothetical protein KAU11_09890 [Candidatus Babeliales bacterium]|nr:hypothetical protein [Candidatus Babeliales bacterium]